MFTPALNLPRVLLVDDSPDEREMYAEWFRRHGYCTLEAPTARDGYRLAVEMMPTLAIIDVRLPGEEDGVSLTRRIRASEDVKALPIIVLTACVFEDDRQAATRAGCDFFMSKPCLPAALGEAVALLLSSRMPQQWLRSDSSHGVTRPRPLP